MKRDLTRDPVCPNQTQCLLIRVVVKIPGGVWMVFVGVGWRAFPRGRRRIGDLARGGFPVDRNVILDMSAAYQNGRKYWVQEILVKKKKKKRSDVILNRWFFVSIEFFNSWNFLSFGFLILWTVSNCQLRGAFPTVIFMIWRLKMICLKLWNFLHFPLLC